MSYDPKTGFCFCERCGHDWTSKNKKIEPRSCAKCKSTKWNKPRVYAGKWSPIVLAKRFLPTGKAARKKD